MPHCEETDAVDAQIARLASTLKAAAQAAFHRRILVLSGNQSWCRRVARDVLERVALDPVLWVSCAAPPESRSILAAKAHKVLGREVGGLVFDAYCGFDADAFGAAVGTIRGGGLLLLLIPRLAEWPQFADPEHARIAVHPFPPGAVTGRFLCRMVRVLTTNDLVPIVEQGGGIPPLAPMSTLPAPAVPADGVCRTRDQRQAVEAILKAARGHRHRPVVLTSDRGRGKSAALGIAAAHLLERGLAHIVVTAPRLDAVEPLFERAQRLLPGAILRRGGLCYGAAEIEFLPPDQLIRNDRQADLVLVDEAAAIPIPLLERLLHQYARIAFATTIHGYEGTGRGFALRFRHVLDRVTPEWNSLQLETPVRWAAGDPLERLVFRALLLDAAPAPEDILQKLTHAGCVIERVERNRLIDDETTLSEIFGLLVLAHYQTRPTDLRHLLDGPNLSIYVIRYRGHVAATALLAEEGGFDAGLAREVYLGRRRPRGHLIAQSLAVHLGLEQAPLLRGYRVMRIAVHPSIQRRGVGSLLLSVIAQQAQERDMDFAGASFGATTNLLTFWKRMGFLPVRVGLARGAATGEHSALVLKPLSVAGRALYDVARDRFRVYFPHLLSDPLRDLDPNLASCLLRLVSTPTPLDLDAQDQRDLASFAFGLRGYEVNLVPIWKLACAALTDPAIETVLSPEQHRLLIAKVLQKRSWGEVAALLALPGRAVTLERLRKIIQVLLQHCMGM